MNSDTSLKLDNFDDLDSGDLSLDLDLDLDLDLRDDPPRRDHPSSGVLQEDFEEELSDAAKAVKAYYKQSYDRKKEITDSGYYFCVCFQTAEQCRAFLAATGWEGRTEVGARFINGLDLARRMGVKLEKTREHPKRMPPRPRFLDEALEVECADDEEKIRERSGSALAPRTQEAEPNAAVAELERTKPSRRKS